MPHSGNLTNMLCKVATSAFFVAVAFGQEDPGLVLLQMHAQAQSVHRGEGNISVDTANGPDTDVSSHRGILLRFMPSHDVAVCACAKCGSTALWSWLFEHERGHPFSEDIARKGTDVQDVENEPWNGVFVIQKTKDEQEAVMKSAYTFALIRDPKERLVSAWKSKVACGDRDEYGTNIHARAGIVESTLKLWGRSSLQGHDCLELEEFMQVLHDIHEDGNAANLNGHFMPQDKSCFARDPPSKWSKVEDIASSAPFSPLGERLGYKDLPVHSHASTSTIRVSASVDKILTEITADEYKMLKPYLSRPSKVAAGEYVLVEEDAPERM